MSYIYHSLYAYFKRDNVALPGMAAFFKDGGCRLRGGLCNSFYQNELHKFDVCGVTLIRRRPLID